MIDAETGARPRVLAILVAGLLGFLAGQVVATSLDALTARVTHFPGGLRALSNTASPPWWANVLGLAGLWIGFAATIYYAYAHGNLRNLPDQWRPRPSDVLYVALGVVCQLLVDLTYRPFHLKNLNGPVNHLFGAAHGVTFVLLIVMTMFLAPMMEEWFFRGVIFRALSEGGHRGGSRGAVVGAVTLSAVLFALAHGEPLQFAGLAFVGVVLAVLVYRTKRLIPSIVTHVSFNGVAIAALISQRNGH